MVHSQVQARSTLRASYTLLCLCAILISDAVCRIVKWWRGDKTPDSLERPPRESGDDSEAQQAEQAAKDATQDPNAGISNTSARQTPSKQSSAASSSNASTLGQTAAGQSQRAGRSGPGSSGPDNIGSAPQNTQDQSSGGWLSWLTGGRSSSSQQVSQAVLCTVSCEAGLGHGSHMSVRSHLGCQARGRQARRHGEHSRATASGRAASKTS